MARVRSSESEMPMIMHAERDVQRKKRGVNEAVTEMRMGIINRKQSIGSWNTWLGVGIGIHRFFSCS